MCFVVLTGRYNNDTWQATCNYREKRKIKTIYAPPFKISRNVPQNMISFVIEMNNDINKIMGIGLIRNKLALDRVYKVQEDTSCNKYIYIGDHHMSRDLLLYYNPKLVKILDIILFKGYTHSKRGLGLTRIPEKVLALDACQCLDIKQEIKDVFMRHYKVATTSTFNTK